MDDTGANEATPLVHDGIMYLPNPRGVIQALDGATGDLIWEYRPGMEAPAPRNPNATTGEQSAIPRQSQRPVAAPPPTQGQGDGGRGIQRNIAIYGDKIYGTTNEAHIVAVDAKTGKLVWDTTMADQKLGYEYTAGPIVVTGKVIAGITGCSRYKEDVCFIAGLDANTGKELWRTSSIARPGEPGGDTWGDLPLKFRAGGDMWMSGSYDPETGLVYWGTAQAKPWARAVRGTDGAALYTSSTLALDPDTGKMKWYYQHIPGETQDMDETFERILVDVGGVKSMFTMGKLGILWQIDRVTGKFVHAYDLGYQNILEVNGTSGKVTYNPGMIPQVGVQLDMCPEHRRVQELARDGVQPADQRAVRAAEPELRTRDVWSRTGRESRRARRQRSRCGAGTTCTRRRTATSANSWRWTSTRDESSGVSAIRRR